MKSSITSRHKFASQLSDMEEETTAFRPTTTNTSFLFMEKEEELKKYKRMVQDLEAVAKQQRLQREEIEQKMRMLSRRTVLREKQFHNILQKNFALYSKMDKKDDEAKKADFMKFYDKIFDNFDNMNEATNTFIEKRYSENMRSMQYRINQIMDVLQAQLTKMNRLKDMDRLGLQKNIQEVLHLAKIIQEDNIKTKQKMQDFTLKNKLLQEEKELLIEEVIQKKQLIIKLYMENKKFKQDPNYQVVEGSEIGKKNSAQSFKVDMEKPKETKRFQNHKRSNSGTSRSKQISMNKDVGMNLLKIDIKPDHFITESLMKNSEPVSPKAERYSQSRLNNRSERAGPKTLSLKRRQLEKQTTNSFNPIKVIDYQKLISHLKISLQREKKKNQQLMRMMTKLQSQNQEINTAIGQIIKQHKKNKKGENGLETLMKSQKLFQVIRNLKKRLSMLETPAYSCGWGTQGIETSLYQDIFQKQKDQQAVQKEAKVKS